MMKEEDEQQQGEVHLADLKSQSEQEEIPIGEQVSEVTRFLRFLCMRSVNQLNLCAKVRRCALQRQD